MTMIFQVVPNAALFCLSFNFDVVFPFGSFVVITAGVQLAPADDVIERPAQSCSDF